MTIVVAPGRDLRLDIASTKSALFELAESPSLSERRDSLLALAGAIDSEDAHIWAKVDLFAAFGKDAVAVPGADRRDSQITVWEWARNVLVLLPLLITWSGVALASYQYGQLTRLAGSVDALPRIRDVANRPFIALWEQGFDNIDGLPEDLWRSLAGWFDLTMVASLDLAAIFMVIATSVRVGYLRRHREVTLENRFQQVWNQLRETLTYASFHLSKRAFDTPLRVTEELGKATNQLSSITNHVLDAEERAKNRLDHITESITTFNSRLAAHEEVVAGLNVTAKSLSDNLRGARDDIAQIGATFSDTATQERILVDQLGETSRQLATTTVESLSQASQIASATSELVSALTAERGVQSAVSESLAGSATALRNSADEIRRQWEQLGENRIDLRSDLQSLQEVLGQAGEQMQQVADHVNIAYQLFPELEQTNRELADSFSSSTQALDNSARNITTSTSDALGSFLVAATGQLDEQVEAATKEVTASLHEAAAALRSATEGVLDSTQDSMDSYQQANQGVIAELREAARALQAAGIHVSGSWKEASDNRNDLHLETIALREAVEILVARLEELAKQINPPQPATEDPTDY